MLSQMKQKEPVKAYNMAILNDTDAEINMYGEVVSNIPTDWWTGEKLPGNYIAVEEFLQDLESIQDKENITVHINSPGGELYAGVAIYNRLKELSGTVTTINDGLCASAASLIFQAGDIRRMNKGSNLMAHGVSCLLYGYYNVQDLKDLIKQMNAHNDVAMRIYMERSGKTKEEVKNLLNGETWLTGEDAVTAGLADEVAGEEPVQMSITADRKFLYVNHLQIPTAKLCSIPSRATVTVLETMQKTGGNIMNLEELRNAHPELLAEAENSAREAGRQEGINQERTRLQGIEAIENAIADKDIVKNAKYGDNPITAEQLALKAMQQQAQLGVNMLKKMQSDTDDSGVKEVIGTPNNGDVKDELEEEELKNAIAAYKQMKNGGKTNVAQ